MLAVKSKYHSIQAPLIYKSPVEDLDDSNLAKLVVHLVKLFEKEKMNIALLTSNTKVKHQVSLVPNLDILSLKCWDYMLLLLLEAIGHVVRLKNSWMIKARPVCTLQMRICLENQKSTNLKMIMII